MQKALLEFALRIVPNARPLDGELADTVVGIREFPGIRPPFLTCVWATFVKKHGASVWKDHRGQSTFTRKRLLAHLRANFGAAVAVDPTRDYFFDAPSSCGSVAPLFFSKIPVLNIDACQQAVALRRDGRVVSFRVSVPNVDRPVFAYGVLPTLEGVLSEGYEIMLPDVPVRFFLKLWRGAVPELLDVGDAEFRAMVDRAVRNAHEDFYGKKTSMTLRFAGGWVFGDDEHPWPSLAALGAFVDFFKWHLICLAAGRADECEADELVAGEVYENFAKVPFWGAGDIKIF
jgi:hypothetical protein